MKTRISLLMVAIIVAVSAFGQMDSNDKRKVNELNKEIAYCRSAINNYEKHFFGLDDCSAEIKRFEAEYDTLNFRTTATSYGKSLKKQAIKENRKLLNSLLEKQARYETWHPMISLNDSLKAKLKRYELQRDFIFNSSKNVVPTELSTYEMNRRMKALEITRLKRIEKTDSIFRDLDIKKMKSQPVKADSIKGYSGIVQNMSIRSRIKFDFYRIEKKTGKAIMERPIASFMTNPQDTRPAYLEAGKYLVLTYREGIKISENTINVSAQSYDYFGAEQHWYVMREGY